MLPHEKWLFKANHDLKSSKILIQNEDPLPDIAIYHTQQCGEKALKAFLAYNRQTLSKTHNLKTLLEECIDIAPMFNHIFEDCIFLNPFATLYRYPEGDLMPTVEEVKKAIIAAEKILTFVTDIMK